MKLRLNSPLTLTFLMPAALLADSALDYPDAKRSDFVEELHGVQVADPYRWLEDTDSEDTRAWIEAQNELADSYFEGVNHGDAIRDRLTELWDYEKFGLPRKAGERLFYTRKTGLQNQGILYWKPADSEADPIVLLDPNLLSEDGTVALASYSISEDGKYIAYGLSTAGSDWSEWKVREVETGKDLEDHLQWVKFSGASWDRKGEGFYYSRYAAPEEGEELEAVNENQKLYYHRIGTPQSEDQLILERPDEPKWGFSAWVTEDSEYLTVSVWKGSGNENAFFYRKMDSPEATFTELIPDFEDEYSLLGNDGPLFYFKTDKDAPNGRVVSINTEAPEDGFKEILPESTNPLDDVSLLGDYLVASYMVDVLMKVQVHDLEGNHVRDVDLPGVGSVWGFGGRRALGETWYLFTGFTTPGSVYHYDVETGKSTLFASPETAFDSSLYTTTQVFYESKDGTRVPMFITHRKDVELNGQNPTYLYGYGGFNISLTPYYSTSIATWLDMGGVYALANIRGGGEYGEAWHEAGTKDQKQNVFDDFIAAGEYLISEGYTSSEKLAIGGGSNGGLLVGACMNQRPDLFGAGIADVGVFDMLRFHKFTIGWAWTSDFGDPEKAEEFPALLEYSPYHNTQSEVPYPPLLIMTGDHDDRVFPAHSFKFGAAMQHAQVGDEPILLRIETKAGHGAGKPTSKRIEETVTKWSFLAHELGMAPTL